MSQTNKKLAGPFGRMHLSRGCWYALAVIAVMAIWLRCRQLDDEGGLWLDEIWTVMNAAGNGGDLDRLANGAVDLQGEGWTEVAGTWRGVWASGVHDVHPPGFYLLLRGWMSVFGQSDFAVRMLAVAGSVAAMPGLVWLVGRAVDEDCDSSGKQGWRAVMALGLYAVCCGGIFYAQEIRSYMLLQLEVMGLAILMLQYVEVGGRLRAMAIGGLLFAGMMTHYFFAGAAAGIVAWGLCNLVGRRRWAVLASAGFAGGLFTAVWGRQLLEQRHFWAYQDYLREGDRTPAELAVRVLVAPARTFLPSAGERGPWWVASFVALGLFVMVLPPVVARWKLPRVSDATVSSTRRRVIMLAWSWLIGGVVLLLAEDLLRHGRALTVPRYLTHLVPAVCVLLSLMAWPGRRGIACLALVPGVALAIASCFWTWRLAYQPKGFWKQAAAGICPLMRAGDAIVFQSDEPGDWRPKYQYMSFSRYEGPARQLPHVVWMGQLDGAAKAFFATREVRRIWMFSMRKADEPAPAIPGFEQIAAAPSPGRTNEAPASRRLLTRR